MQAGCRMKRIFEFFHRHRLFLFILFVWVMLFAGLRTLQHFSFQTNTYDLSVFDYSMHYTLQGDWFHEPFHGYWGSHFAIHTTFILVFLLPFYLIFQGPLFLLYIQVAACALTAWLLYIICHKEFGKKRDAVFIAVTFLIFRPFLNMLMYDFHPEAFFPLFLLAAYYFIRFRRNTLLYAVFILSALLIKEDIPIFVFFFGLFLGFRLKENRKIGWLTSAGALVYFVIVMQFLIPAFRSETGLQRSYEFFVLWDDLGHNPLQMMKNLALRPWLLWETINWKVSGPNFFNLVAPLLFIPFFSWFFLLVLPPAFILASSQSPMMQGFGLHYAANILPFLFLALADGLKKIRAHLDHLKNGKKIWLILLSVLLAVNMFNTRWNLLRPSRYASLKDYSNVMDCIDRIPRNASVASLSSLIPHIPKRKNIYMLPEMNNAEFLLVHTGVNTWPLTKEEFSGLMEELERKGEYVMLMNQGKVKLYKRHDVRLFTP